MKTNTGSTLAIVMLITFAVGLVVASVVSLVNFQRTMAVRRELQFQANNLAETSLDYAFAFIANDVKRNSVTTSAYIPTGTGYIDFPFTDDARAFLSNTITGPADQTTPTSRVQLSNLAVRVMKPLYDKPIKYVVKSDDPVNRTSQFRNQAVYEQVIPVIARATATYGDTGKSFTAYIRKNIALDEVPMFQKAITYQGQLHLHRGYPILGGVHTNGNLAINAHNDDTAIYNGLVTCAGRFYRGSSFDGGGTGADPYGYCPENAAGELDFRTIYSENISLAATNSNSLKIITSDPSNAALTPTYAQVTTSFDSRQSNWHDQALTLFKGNLLDKAHGILPMIPPGCEGYRLDDATTTETDEFNNSTYGLLEPCIGDSANPAYKPRNIYKFERKATLVFRVECMKQFAPTPTTTASDTTANTYKWIVKAYRKMTESESITDWVPLPMPPGVIGQTKIATGTTPTAGTAPDQYYIATSEINAGAEGTKEVQGLFEEFGLTSATPYVVDTTNLKIAAGNPITKYRLAVDNSGALSSLTTPADRVFGPAHGFFDARLGRGVSPITLNMARLKQVLDGSDTSEVAVAFRSILGVGGDDYNGLVYVEFPTSLTTTGAVSPRAYKSVLPPTPIPYVGDMTALDSYPFVVGSTNDIEKRHPDRMSEADSRATAQPTCVRTDNILPIAKGLRGYPATYTDSEIAKAQWAIPALQIVNGKKLPTVNGVTGLTISTNAPLYLVGSYNCDGNFITGTNITGTHPTDYAVNDPGWNEVSAGLFSDTLTILSDTWGFNSATANRFAQSFPGGNNASNNRMVKDGQVEISACIITGEYPIFEFFLHALENWTDYYNKGGFKNSPICIKGAVVGMFHSEIQHIKGAYGRNVNNDIQVYWSDAGAFAIPAVRIHQQLMDGIFPPGTPLARDYGQNSFAILRPGTADQTILTAAGF